MSIHKFFFVLLLVFSLMVSGTTHALSIRVLEGGVTVGSPRQLFEEGIRLGNSQILRKAWSAYEKALNLNPETLDGYLQLGRIFFHLSLLGTATDEDYEKAKFYASQAITKAPQMADPHHIMGLVLSGRGSYLDAMDELRLALSLNPGNEFIITDIASIHLALHRPEEVIKILEGRPLKNGWSYFILSMAWAQKMEKGRALINLFKAKRMGFRGYWLDKAFSLFQREIQLPAGKVFKY